MDPEFIGYLDECVLRRQCSLKALNSFKRIINSGPSGYDFLPANEYYSALFTVTWSNITANIGQDGSILVFFYDKNTNQLYWNFSNSEQASELILKLLEFAETKNDVDFSRDVVDIQKFSSVLPHLTQH